jgi:uncharacterized protein YbjT (DUF2867 family)
MEGAESVISSFTTRVFQRPRAADFWENDYQGNFNLIQLAQAHQVRKYVFVSYWGLAKCGDFEHGKVKKAVEDLLRVSGLDYTVFRVTTLATDMSVLLGERLKKKGWVPLCMKSDALHNASASRRIVEMAGEEEYTFAELRDLFSRVLQKKVRFIFVPPPVAYGIATVVDNITGRAYNARGLVSAFTGGSTCDLSEMKRIFPITQGSFAHYLEEYFHSTTL